MSVTSWQQCVPHSITALSEGPSHVDKLKWIGQRPTVFHRVKLEIEMKKILAQVVLLTLLAGAVAGCATPPPPQKAPVISKG